MDNLLLKAVNEKGNAVGTFLGVSNEAIVEDLGYTGLDFVIIDTEHGPYDTMPMSNLIMTARKANMAPIVRVADVTHKEIQRAVDNGAQGIIVPCLRDIEEFKKVIDLAKFAPIGLRGFIKGRGCGFGNEPWAAGTLEEYMKNSNERVLVLPQCETVESLEVIEEIVQLEGLDGIFVGPFDLSISMGIPAQFDAPEFQDAILRILTACKKENKICMIYCNNEAESRKYLKAGFDAVANSLDFIVFAEAYKRIVTLIRK